MNKDKRRYARHAISSESLFIASLNSGKYASVRNISMTGLAFEHFAGAGDVRGCTSIDIFMSGQDRLYLTNMKCRVIYDIAELSENITFSGSASRVCGLQFVSLSAEQKTDLVKLLSSKATRPIKNGAFEQGRETKLLKSNY